MLALRALTRPFKTNPPPFSLCQRMFAHRKFPDPLLLIPWLVRRVTNGEVKPWASVFSAGHVRDR